MIYKKVIIGWFFILVGLLIVFTPFTPGSIILLIGLNMVFGDWPEWQNFKQKVKEYWRKYFTRQSS